MRHIAFYLCFNATISPFNATISPFKLSMRKYLTCCFILALLPSLPGCQTSKTEFQSLIKDVEQYHRDLIFERYEIAARRIAPNSRASWLDGINSQKLRFAEIEVVSSSPCQHSDPDEDKGCFVIESQMQWYPGNSPSVYTGRVFSTWEYNKAEKGWLIVEQEQKF